MKTKVTCGKILMENGAEAYRTEDTLKVGLLDKVLVMISTDEYYTHVTFNWASLLDWRLWGLIFEG